MAVALQVGRTDTMRTGRVVLHLGGVSLVLGAEALDKETPLVASIVLVTGGV